MRHCIEATEKINSVRALVGIHPSTRVEVQIRPRHPDRDVAAGLTGEEERAFSEEFSTWKDYIKILAKIDRITLLESRDNTPQSGAPFVLNWCMGWVLLEDKSELDALILKLKKQQTQNTHFIYVHEQRENDPNFIARANEETKSANTAKLQALRSEAANLNFILLHLGV